MSQYTDAFERCTKGLDAIFVGAIAMSYSAEVIAACNAAWNMTRAFAAGEQVMVLPPYVGSGRLGCDDWTGRIMEVYGPCCDRGDYYLRSNGEDRPREWPWWTVIMHSSRLIPVPRESGVEDERQTS